MSEGYSLIKIDGEWAKPATVLIEKIAEAVGGLSKPYQIKRVAKAKAEAELIEAQAERKITALRRRALTRFITEEAKKQENIESITKKALPQLNESSDPQNIENDWITNFFDKCRIVSDEEMQILWAKILAGEANSPRTYSKRTVNLLSSLDKYDAQLFTNFCRFSFEFAGLESFVYDLTEAIYKNQKINFDSLVHLDNAGLIRFDPSGGFAVIDLSSPFDIHYYGNALRVSFNNLPNNKIDIGKTMFTATGLELAKICSSTPVDGFLDYVIKKLTEQGLTVVPLLQSPE
ncbi:MAG TPA: DUF2806 domain-containing protein [Dehalococcoidales bacterium]